MKNMVFANSTLDVANYLAQRENEFLVGLKLPDTLSRQGKSGGNVYECTLTDFCSKEGISYRINLFLHENKVRILVPERTYIVTLEYAQKYTGSSQFSFTLEQQLLECMLVFDDFTNDITFASEIIDAQIENLIQEDVSSLFKGIRLDDRNEWRLTYKGKFPPCSIKEKYRI